MHAHSYVIIRRHVDWYATEMLYKWEIERFPSNATMNLWSSQSQSAAQKCCNMYMCVSVQNAVQRSSIEDSTRYDEFTAALSSLWATVVRMSSFSYFHWICISQMYLCNYIWRHCSVFLIGVALVVGAILCVCCLCCLFAWRPITNENSTVVIQYKWTVYPCSVMISPNGNSVAYMHVQPCCMCAFCSHLI